MHAPAPAMRGVTAFDQQKADRAGGPGQSSAIVLPDVGARRRAVKSREERRRLAVAGRFRPKPTLGQGEDRIRTALAIVVVLSRTGSELSWEVAPRRHLHLALSIEHRAFVH
jgi:hypothetical protein